ncbi:transcriptional regulator GutM [Lacticaseibacillus paracasei]|uniref:transcriptional regulator GutM n=1 Tax=Lacticaseibacillus paracasei TaxID=1597 RepID=UPI0021C38040|nr:transcriptional regulator GutM [Lacticaseibacillus paracasei]MCP9304943.1 transcriptional regulator GutM [Lacticaseibacillus paracasei]
MNILILGIFIAAAFLLQALMGYFQIRNFAHNYHEVRQDGRVLIGKNPRRFRQGSLMLIGLDHDDRIQEIRVMKGLTVFSRFRDVNQFDGELVAEVGADYTALQKLSRTERECFLNAYRNYVNYKTNNLSFEDFDTSRVSMFSLPIFNEIGIKMKAIPQMLTNVFKKNTI